MAAFAGSQSEMWIQLIEAFGGSRPGSMEQTELWISLINAVTAFSPGGGGTNAVRAFTITPSSQYAQGHTITDQNGSSVLATGTTITDWFPLISPGFNGLQPQLDLLTGGTAGLLTSAGAAPVPLWNPAIMPGSNTGLLVAGSPVGPRASSSYSAGIATVSNTPVQSNWTYVSAQTNLQAVISQDGTAAIPVAASGGAASAVTFPLTTSSSANQFVFTAPTSTGGSGTPETFTIATNTYNSYNTTTPQLIPALAAATGSVSGEAFSTKCTTTVSGGNLFFTSTTVGAWANGTTLGQGQVGHDIGAALGFAPPVILIGGMGGDPGSSTGQVIILLATSST